MPGSRRRCCCRAVGRVFRPWLGLLRGWWCRVCRPASGSPILTVFVPFIRYPRGRAGLRLSACPGSPRTRRGAASDARDSSSPGLEQCLLRVSAAGYGVREPAATCRAAAGLLYLALAVALHRPGPIADKAICGDVVELLGVAPPGGALVPGAARAFPDRRGALVFVLAPGDPVVSDGLRQGEPHAEALAWAGPVNGEQFRYVLGGAVVSFGVEVASPAQDAGRVFDDVEDGVMCLAERVDSEQVSTATVSWPGYAHALTGERFALPVEFAARPVVVVPAAGHAAPGREHPRQDGQHVRRHRAGLGGAARAR